MPSLGLKTSVQFVKGVGPKMAQRLQKLKIANIWDLLNYYPFRYKNYALTSSIANIQEEETVTIRGKIKEIKNEYLRGGKKIQRAVFEDNSGQINVVWFNQPFLTKALPKGKEIALSGKIKKFRNALTLVSPEYEIISSLYKKYKTIHTGRLVPVYSETAKISSKYLRKLVAQSLLQTKEQIREIFPSKILTKYGLMPRKEAIEKIHFPENKAAAAKARQRLAFEEMFFIQLRALIRRKNWQRKKQSFAALKKLKINLSPFIKSLPFKLTFSQKKVIEEIVNDLKKKTPMNRLLQGDVGSGKTVVVAAAAYATITNGYQVAFMAPTEILAFQHYQTLKGFFAPFSVPVELLTRTKKLRKKTKAAKIILGTHALLHQKRIFRNLGLIIIDEQHRFGVRQRGNLVKKAAENQSFFPHLLTLTATPIPRSVALALHGDLDLSLITQMPPGRKKVATFVIKQKDREKCYRWLEKEIKKRKIQAFIICPFIEPSENLTTIAAAKEEFARLKKEVFPNLKLALLHGKTASRQKESILKKMQKGKINILVATPVVEVGIDIPQATVMIIEAADRFGLAQLHQLRGRVGRNKKKSYCFLFAETPGRKAIGRLRAMEHHHQGLKLAKLDLKIRGPGEIYGLKQHGFPKLKLANLNNLKLIKQAREAAEEACNLQGKKVQ